MHTNIMTHGTGLVLFTLFLAGTACRTDAKQHTKKLRKAIKESAKVQEAAYPQRPFAAREPRLFVPGGQPLSMRHGGPSALLDLSELSGSGSRFFPWKLMEIQQRYLPVVHLEPRRVALPVRARPPYAMLPKDQPNAFVAGLLQKPFSKSGRSGAFPATLEDVAEQPQYDLLAGTPLLNPWDKNGGIPTGCPEDPFALVSDELVDFTDRIEIMMPSQLPIFRYVMKDLVSQQQGKPLLPTIVMLMGAATASDPAAHRDSDIYKRQADLSLIAEIMRIALLIHSDVINKAVQPNKVAILVGDYLLSEASVMLGALENTDATQIMATALESLVEVCHNVEQVFVGVRDLHHFTLHKAFERCRHDLRCVGVLQGSEHDRRF